MRRLDGKDLCLAEAVRAAVVAEALLTQVSASGTDERAIP